MGMTGTRKVSESITPIPNPKAALFLLKLNAIAHGPNLALVMNPQTLRELTPVQLAS